MERPSAGMWLIRQQRFNLSAGHVGNGFNFVRVWHNGQRVVQHGIDPDEFPSGVGTSIQLELLLQRSNWQHQSKLFLNFPVSGCIVAFTGIQMAGCTGVIAAGKSILGHGPFLNEQGTRWVENQNMNCPVEQPAGMRFVPCGLANDLILRINDIENFYRKC